MCELGFIEQLEGLLGEGDYLPELLFVLREPNCDNETNFWFKKDVVRKAYDGNMEQELKGSKKRYFNILSIIARKVFGVGEEDKFVFDRCAYMNLHPFRGGSESSKEYKGILKVAKKMSIEKYEDSIVGIDRESKPNEIAANRIGIIKRAIDNGVKNLVTTEDIYDAIKKVWNVQEKDQDHYILEYNFNDGRENPKKKRFQVCYIGENKQIRVISFWHPSCTLINQTYLNKIHIPE